MVAPLHHPSTATHTCASFRHGNFSPAGLGNRIPEPRRRTRKSEPVPKALRDIEQALELDPELRNIINSNETFIQFRDS